MYGRMYGSTLMYSAAVKISPSFKAGKFSFTSSKFAAVGSPLNSFTYKNLRAFKALLENNRLIIVNEFYAVSVELGLKIKINFVIKKEYYQSLGTR